jgi:hypothetical protein
MPSALNNTPQLFATCVTRAKNSEAAWKVYAHGQGLGARCVQLELDVVALRNQIRKSGYHFEECDVEYKSESFILNLHKPRLNFGLNSSGNFTFDTFLRLLSLKRIAYSYEEEIRLFIVPDFKNNLRHSARMASSRDLNINWSQVIKSVRIDKKSTDGELLVVQQACIYANINPSIGGYTFTGSLPVPRGLVTIPFERFDIDDMPNAGKITVK